ncbi:type II secretion system inner membrane protein GspF [Marinomonas mediterranea]|uniref:General secretion pathway protein F n=1 Tax=Marinomonas mediterranea (strain ATCC 700492 / JCM 21426 / NBRC 103028 / MMB-1) TaxID=717774 RepID=F2K4G4_MARM1|nr:type II secretion system inner membrane protein GspF [Marinomonas mediterranea]ADZ90263.1 general secretion pathway protein F [Marinomonas mediterranea MMB-1]WCN16455.1 type II secretion system inner membrane protein GspF [Marinomonas mediterranea MMB-1]
MAAFEYTALNHKGRKKKGVLEADNERILRQRLRDQGLVLIDARRGKEQTKSSFFSPSIDVKERALVTRQLATLIDAGMPIEEALSGVAQQTTKQRIRSMLLAIRSKVLEGHPLASALAEYPKAFPILFRASIKAGEESGGLPQVLMQLADYSERVRGNQQKLQMAMLYPAILTIVAISIVVFLLGSVMPDIVSVFERQDAALPQITQVMLAISNWLQSNGKVTFVIFIVLLLLYIVLIQKESIRTLRDHWVLAVPGLRSMIKTVQVTRFISTLSMLTTSGVSLVEAMSIATQVSANRSIQKRLAKAQQSVREGGSLGDALNKTKLLPPMMLQLIISGERSGDLDIMLSKAARQQEDDTNNWISAMVGLFEPIMLLVMGGVVMMIVMAILLPIMNMNQLLG